MRGKPITIVKALDHSFELDVKALEEILGKSDICDKNVVVVSVVGAFRKGKSFLLNFMLRYLESMCDPLWLGKDDEPLEGFHWRGGSERDTTGILLWSEAFIVTIPTGDQVVVLLMDTQGSFDSDSTVKECATVFALSTMISSVQIYNLSQNIQEDDLQHLELFSAYGQLALENTHETPFQKLVFLVRDWSFPYEAPFGETGGKTILDRRLQISKQQHPQSRSIRSHIRECFSDVTCFLMPHPGLAVATDPDFDGRLSAIREEFKEQLQVLVMMILSPQNILPKNIGGFYVRTKDLIAYFKTYMQIFQGDDLPEPKTILQATAEANNLTAVAIAKDLYNDLMERVCGGCSPYVPRSVIERTHVDAQHKAFTRFIQFRKMGDENFCNFYRNELEKVISDKFNSFINFNESKRLMNAARTPGTLFFIIIFCYVNSSFLNAVGLSTASSACNLFLGLCLILLSFWCYIRCTGEYQEAGVYIDIVVNYFWFTLLRPLFTQAQAILLPSSMVAQNSSSAHISSNAFNSTIPTIQNPVRRTR